MKDENIYLLTDGCAWEINKQMGNEHPHAVEVVDLKTGAVRYIKSGSKIKFIEGFISDIRTQKSYNEETQKAKQEMSCQQQDLQKRAECKSTSLRRKPECTPESIQM
jgi:hypothetical protein